MKKIFLIATIIPILMIPVFAQVESEENSIPSWIKSVASAWANDQITDSEYQDAMQFLIEHGIIQIETVQINEITLSDETERLYQLEINQKEDRINILKKQVTDIGLDNSHLLQSIVEKDQLIKQLQTSLENEKAEFKTYKEDYPLKVGKIGGKQVNADTIRELERKIQELETQIQELQED